MTKVFIIILNVQKISSQSRIILLTSMQLSKFETLPVDLHKDGELPSLPFLESMFPSIKPEDAVDLIGFPYLSPKAMPPNLTEYTHMQQT